MMHVFVLVSVICVHPIRALRAAQFYLHDIAAHGGMRDASTLQLSIVYVLLYIGVLALARDAVSSLALGRPGEEKYYQHLEVSTQPG